MAAKRAPNRFYNLQRRFFVIVWGVLFGSSGRFPLGRSVHGQRVSVAPTWKENTAFAKAQSPVVVLFSVLFFLFCCRIEEKDGSSRSLCWRALFYAAVTRDGQTFPKSTEIRNSVAFRAVFSVFFRPYFSVVAESVSEQLLQRTGRLGGQFWLSKESVSTLVDTKYGLQKVRTCKIDGLYR